MQCQLQFAIGHTQSRRRPPWQPAAGVAAAATCNLTLVCKHITYKQQIILATALHTSALLPALAFAAAICFVLAATGESTYLSGVLFVAECLIAGHRHIRVVAFIEFGGTTLVAFN